VSPPWFTADPHLFHTRIIDFCNRPFRTLDGQPDVQAMNEGLIRRHNDVVAPDDEVFILGDMLFGGMKRLMEVAPRLHGRKTLVLGNHDRLTNTQYRVAGFEVRKYMKLGKVLLIHRPPSDAEADRHKLVLCGHVHTDWRERGNCINVGVDVRDYRPVSLEDLGLPRKLLVN
jgi:calcineurin-like phosphoesterase family protein